MRRRVIVVFALVASLLMASSMPVGALQTSTALGSIHTNDTDFSNAAQLSDVAVKGSGDSASVTLTQQTYSVVQDSGDGTAESDRLWVGDDTSDRSKPSEIKTVPDFSGNITNLTVVIDSTLGSDYGFTVDVYAVQENPDGIYGEGTLVKSGYDPTFATGEQTIELDTELSVGSGETWTFEFVTSGTDNDGTNDGLRIQTDEDSGLTGWYSVDGTVIDAGGDAILAGGSVDTGTYVSATHSVDNAESGFANATLDNASMEVTWLADRDGDGTFETEAASGTFTTSGNHTVDISATDATDWRANVTFTTTGDDPTAELHDEGVEFVNHEPQVFNATGSPTGTLTTSSPTLSIDVNDTEFETTQGESVTVEFFVDGAAVGTDTLTSSGTAELQHSFTGGDHTWHAVATDSYGLSNTSQTFSVTVPSVLTIREETAPHDKITSATVSVKFYERSETNPTIINRTTTNGEVDLSGLPLGTEFVATVKAPGYHNRSVLIESIFEQNSVFLLNDSRPTIENRFVLRDQTGEFPPGESQLVVQKAINRSHYNGSPSGFSWTAIAGDDLGADQSFTATLEDGDRYRIVVQNTEGDQRILGAYTASTTGTIELQVGSVVVDPEAPKTVGWEATRTNSSGTVTVNFEYNDSTDSTDTLWLTIYEYNNESNALLSNTSFSGPYGQFSNTQVLSGDEVNTTWAVKFTAIRSGAPNVQAVRVVGPTKPILGDLPNWVKALISIGTIWIVAGLFSQLNGDIGAIVVAGLGGLFWFIGFLPGATGVGVVVLSMCTAGIIFVRGRGGGGL